jgi:hypothetical protein
VEIVSLSPDVITLLRALLEVADNLERALTLEPPQGEGVEAFVEGVRGIHRQLSDLLARYGLRAFSSLGVPFDPARHEALGQTHSESVPAQQVSVEIRRGYICDDAAGPRLFRPAQVMVSLGPPPPKASGDFAATPGTGLRRQPQLERSAVNRPPWVVSPPASSQGLFNFTLTAPGAADPEDGRARAQDALVPRLVRTLAALEPQHPTANAYEALGAHVPDQIPGSFGRLLERVPEAAAWIQDYFWERLTTEIRGRVVDVALLLSLPQAQLTSLLAQHGAPEGWLGLTLVNPGPLLRALSPELRGGWIIDATPTGLASRAGLEVGDLITKVGHRPAEDAPSARRLLNLVAQAHRPFEIEFARGPNDTRTARLDPGRSGRPY